MILAKRPVGGGVAREIGERIDQKLEDERRSTGSVAKSGWLVTCLRDLERGVEA